MPNYLVAWRTLDSCLDPWGEISVEAVELPNYVRNEADLEEIIKILAADHDIRPPFTPEILSFSRFES
jgi:hypothetical protein